MRYIHFKGGVIALMLLTITLQGRDFDAINTDPNNPVEASLETVLPNAQMNIIFSLTGADPGWYSSVLVQHTTGVHAQLHDADQLRALTPTIVNNSWNAMYATALQDLDYIIETGTERENWNYVGIAKVLMAYMFQLGTDLWERIPYSQALQGAENLKPAYDDQEVIYADLVRLLDEAIADLNRTSLGNAGRFDLLYGGDAAGWRRAAYSLQARVHNRLSKRDPQGSATRSLEAATNGFETPAHSLVFQGYTSTATEEHPWYQEFNDRRHHAWSERMDDLMLEYDDPRREIFAARRVTRRQGRSSPRRMERQVSTREVLSTPSFRRM